MMNKNENNTINVKNLKKKGNNKSVAGKEIN